MTPSVDVTLILVNFHSGEPLRRFFASLAAHPIAASCEVVLVDNSPGDGVASWLAETQPDVLVLPMERNVGYAGAVNAALEQARGRALLVVNPDIELSAGGIDACLAYLDDHPEVGMVGPRLQYPDGTVQQSARRFYTFFTIVLRRTPLGRIMPDHPLLRRHLMLDDDLTRARPVDWVLGAFMLARREAVEAVGPMDARFFLYFEDVDWCYRMWEAGWEVHYLPDATFSHDYARSSGKMGRTLVYHLRSFLSFYDKWGGLISVARRLRGVWEVGAAVASDVVALNVAFLIAYFVRRVLDPWFPERLFDLSDYLPLLAFTNLVSLALLPWLGRYRRRTAERTLSRWLDAVRAALLVALVVMAGTYLSHTRTFSRAVLLLFVPTYLVALELMRQLRLRILGGGQSRGKITRVLLLGTRPGIRRLSGLIPDRTGLVVAGCIPTEPEGGIGLPVRELGALEDLGERIERYRIDELLVDGIDPPTEEVLAAAREVAVQTVPVLVSHPWATAMAGEEAGVRRHGVSWWRLGSPAACSGLAWSKGIVDRGVGLLLSLLSLPGFVLCFAFGRLLGLVQLQPVRRLGRLRTGVQWRELVWRRTQRPLWGLVQLPLFLQVLAGRLSLVGPYPLPVGLEEELGPIQRLRFAVKPGLSGPWQHHLGSRSLRQITDDDLDYLERWSWMLDLDLFLSALPRILAGRDRWHQLSSSSP